MQNPSVCIYTLDRKVRVGTIGLLFKITTRESDHPLENKVTYLLRDIYLIYTGKFRVKYGTLKHAKLD